MDTDENGPLDALLEHLGEDWDLPDVGALHLEEPSSSSDDSESD